MYHKLPTKKSSPISPGFSGPWLRGNCDTCGRTSLSLLGIGQLTNRRRKYGTMLSNHTRQLQPCRRYNRWGHEMYKRRGDPSTVGYHSLHTNLSFLSRPLYLQQYPLQSRCEQTRILFKNYLEIHRVKHVIEPVQAPQIGQCTTAEPRRHGTFNEVPCRR
jgi:hypothetical protein